MQWPLRAVRTIRHGAATTEIAKGPSVPKVQTKSALAPIVARRATAPERANAFLFGPCTARFSFGTTKEKWGGALPSHQHG